MTLYLGSSEINPVETVEVIKEVPTEQDLTLMGNELRRAYCWTKQENINGMCMFYDTTTGIFSSPFSATNIYISSSSNRYSHSGNINFYAVIDGKLYSCVSSSTSITMTQQGSDSDWGEVLFYNTTYCSKNGLLYSSINNAQNNQSNMGSAINLYPILYSNPGSYEYLNNGYYRNNSSYINRQFTDFYSYLGGNYYALGISENKLYSIYMSGYVVNKLLDITITSSDLFSTDYYQTYFALGVDNVLYFYSFSKGSASLQKTYTFESNIKKIMTPVYSEVYRKLVLLDNNKLYIYKNGTATKLLDNVKDLFGYINSNSIITNDNKLYTYIDNNLKLLNSFNGNIEKKYIKNYNEYINCITITEDTIITTNKYTTQYIDEITKAYPTYIFAEDSSNVTSKTNTSITINGNEYTRNGSGDAVFTFVPEDLENHTFTDTDLLQAYLDAGIRQQQNNT